MQSGKCEYDEVKPKVIKIREIPPAEYETIVKKSRESEQKARELEKRWLYQSGGACFVCQSAYVCHEEAV